ncbi:MAG: monovalent cation/H+ antiporter complex subunit F [Actinomycetota bacterium]
MSTVALVLFLLCGVGGTYRLLRGPSLADRIVALDVILIGFMGALVVDAAETGSTTYLILVIVLSIIGFTATVAAARFLQYQALLPDPEEAEQ